MTASLGEYYVMQDDLRVGSALIGKYPSLPLEVSWFGGRKIKETLPTPLLFQVLRESGTWMSAFFGSGIPLMRVDLIAALEEAGVANLDYYDAKVEDPRDGSVFETYRAVNVVGVISAADIGQSQLNPENPSRLIDADFDSLTIDVRKAGGALMFRLAECVSAIVVHERVRRHVEPLEFPGVAFVPPENWIG